MSMYVYSLIKTEMVTGYSLVMFHGTAMNDDSSSSFYAFRFAGPSNFLKEVDSSGSSSPTAANDVFSN